MLCENLPVLEWIRRSLPGMALEREGNTHTGTGPLKSGGAHRP